MHLEVVGDVLFSHLFYIF